MSADRNLLFGILALQMDFITRDQLVAAMNAWVLAKHSPLGEILVEQQAIPAFKRQLLEPLVDQHVRDHGDDPQKSLASLSSVNSIGRMLQVISDSDVQASLDRVGQAQASGPTNPITLDYDPTARYRILRPHAKGGLGEVYVAEDAELHREVALKEIQPEKDRPDNRTRFLLEAEITGGLEHPGIVPVYGLGHHDDGRPYYAMRFIRGDNLGEAIKRFHAGLPDFNSLEFRRLLQRFIDVCQAIAYAHSRGVLHRDLKPGNIMLGKYGETLVVDWGLAKTQASRERERPASDEPTLIPASGSNASPTIHGSAIGTPAYMSPEQAEGKLDLLGPASDVYSLGATLYHLLAGQSPNAGQDVISVLAKAQLGEFDVPRKVQPAIPRPLEAICLKAMSMKLSDRYLSAQALAADVEHWLADEPVAAFAEPLSVRARRWARKHPGPVASLAASLIVGVIGLGAGLFFVNAERKQTELARQGEESQRIEAERQRDETEAVLKFVEDKVFAAARPEGRGGLGKGVTLERAVEASLPFVAEGFTTLPLTEARLRMTLGASFWYLGRADVAEREYLRARELYTTHRGHDHPDTLQSMNNLAISYFDLGRHAEALAVNEETLKLKQARLGHDHPAALTSISNLASSYADLGRHAEALALREETLRLRKGKLGPDHPDTIRSMNNLAISYSQLGRHSEALALREEVLRLRRAKLGPDHPDTLACMNNLASSYSALRRYSEALALREETLKVQKLKLGPNHPDTLRSMNNLAISYDALGRQTEALALREETVKLCKAHLGPDHPDTLRSMNNLANSYANLGRHAEALALREETLKLQKSKLGPNHPDTLRSMNNLSTSYAALSRHSEAFAIREETLKLCKAHLGPDHPDTLDSYCGVLESLIALKRFDEAPPYIDEAFAQVKSAAARRLRVNPDLVPDLWSTRFLIAREKADVAGCRAAAKQFEQLQLNDAKHLYTAAGFRSVVAGLDPKGDDADKAMEWLTKAVAAGYRNVGNMKNDTDLDPLRNRDDFKKLLAELEAKVLTEKKPEK